jgi:hypothetical protein
MDKHLLFTFSIISVITTGSLSSTAQCTDPVPSVIKIINDSATLSWPAVTNAVGYEYVVQLSTLPQPSSGTPTTSTTVGVNNLPYAAHKAWVRTDCAASGFSNWASISFTIVCSTPATIITADITQNTANISWPQVADINTYQYVLDNMSSNPAGAGTVINGTSYPATGLTPGTDYYMHVRTDCGGGTFSSWTTQKFTTLFPAGISSTTNPASIRVYPNPVNDMLTLETPAAGTVTVTNSLGAVVYHASMQDKTLSINTANFATGLYFMRFSNDEETHSIKILKQ